MESLLFAVIKKVDFWIRPTGIRRWIIVFFLFALSLFVGCLVYNTGGITYVFSHTMYVPIILSSMIFGIKGALIASVVCGLILGPYMPITTEPLVYQNTLNWLYRIMIFLANSLVVAYFFDAAYKIFKRMEKSLFFDSTTELPNVLALRRKIIENDENHDSFFLANVFVGNYANSVGALGLDRYTSFVKLYAEHIKQRFDFIEDIYFLQNNNLAFILKQESDLDVLLQELYDFREKVSVNDDLMSYPDIYIGIVNNKPSKENDPLRTIEKSYYLAFKAFNAKVPFLKYSKDIDHEIVKHHRFISTFPDAIRAGEIVLYYQPKVLLSEKKIIGVEALVRWLHPIKGVISPMEWIPVIENTRLIEMLTEFVFEATLKQIKAWDSRGVKIKASVNVSTFNLHHEFATFVLDKLNEYAVNPSQVELEITETSFYNNLNEVVTIMEYLSDKGLEFSIDDFGTGFSSLSYLKDLPVNSIKIDQVFIKNLQKDPTSVAITKSAVDISKTLNIKTIAEGIENEECETILKDIGCQIGQGFYYSKPLPIEEFEQFMKNF